MRYLKVLPGTLFLIILLSLTACNSGSDDNPSGPNGGNNTPGTGSWRVSYFFDKQDETSNFNNYRFEFAANGSLVATNAGQSWNGTWGSGFDDSANKFLMDFSGTVPNVLTELEEDWRIIEMRDDFMHFEHTSGGNGDTDIVKFTK